MFVLLIDGPRNMIVVHTCTENELR